jgi:hypothetical protein
MRCHIVCWRCSWLQVVCGLTVRCFQAVIPPVNQADFLLTAFSPQVSLQQLSKGFMVHGIIAGENGVAPALMEKSFT